MHTFGVSEALNNSGWFRRPGAYVLVDGQFGSTGKGLMASALAYAGGSRITHVTTNAGPNSGHTAWIDQPSPGSETRVSTKVMTQQLPIASIALAARGNRPFTYLNGGAIVDPKILAAEQKAHDLPKLFIHPTAAVIRAEDVATEQGSPDVLRIASTGKGVGAAQAAKVLRSNNVAGASLIFGSAWLEVAAMFWDWDRDVVFVETAQGFSLGLNEPRFHPFTTSRECTVMQAIADARIPHGRVRNVCACYRTFPIRVGNTVHGQSGNCYPDQLETSWEALGLEPEYTSVTGRKRRVFTWSRQQFMESVAANEPDTIFINFMNYLKGSHEEFVNQVVADYRSVMKLSPALVLLGFGPKAEDIRVW